MNDKGKAFGSNRKKLFSVIAIIIVIIMILSAFYIWNRFQTIPEEHDIDKTDKIEFTIEMGVAQDGENKSINFQLKNISDRTFRYTTPRIGKNLDVYITASNGTVYHYTGPFDTGLPVWENLSPGEIKYGQIWFGYKIFTTPSGENYTNWRNLTTEECWYFQQGTYEIYVEYESLPNDKINDVIAGIWHSNVITFTIE